MPRLTRRQFLTTAALATAAPAALAQSQDEVDLLLVLAADVSRSVDGPKFQLQRDGYAASLVDPRVLASIKVGRLGRIAVCFVEWSGSTAQKVVIDWTIIDGEASGRAFGDKLAELPRSFAERTSISAAIDFSAEQFKRAPYRSDRRTIDVSGDGTNNSGRDVRAARDQAIAQGITINGLVILSDRPLAFNPEHTHPEGGLGKYYRDNVIGGPNAFVVEAESFDSFGKALITKLVTEIALLDTPQQIIVR